MGMRATDDRYRHERERLELALEMIRHEARTGTIRQCTGLSDDRIRRLYATYFKHRPGNAVRRHRGKSPTQASIFFKTPRHRFQAATLATLFDDDGLLELAGAGPGPEGLALGRRMCDVYRAYRRLHEEPLYSFEWAWTLLAVLDAGDEVELAGCTRCGGRFVRDRLSLDDEQCGGCLMQRPAEACRA
jgi:hypothetical protein